MRIRTALRTLCLLTVAVGGCAKKPSETQTPDTTAAPAAAEAPADEDLGAAGGEDELDVLDAQLRAVEAGLVSRGVELDLSQDRMRQLEQMKLEDPRPEPATDGVTTEAAEAQCVRICDLSEAVCNLEDRICSLAERHVGEPRYEAACERAAEDCERASRACRACAS